MRKSALSLLTGALVLATLYYIFRPLAASLVLAAWTAHIVRPLFVRLKSKLHGSRTPAAILTGGLVFVIVAPLALAASSLVPAARSLVDQLRQAPGTKGLLSALVSGGGSPDQGIDILGLARQYGASASRAAGVLASASADVIVGAFVFLCVFFALLVEGERASAWLRDNSPVEPTVFNRMARAFNQAGRGLLIGTGLTALAQGIVAGAIYAALGVPRALLLGMLSVFAALIPLTGTAIVWIPVAAGLVLTGHPGKAAILVALAVLVVGTVDNLLRPWLSRRADVGISAVVVLASIFGGIATLGPWGLLFGPLLVRLTIEAMQIHHDQGRASPDPGAQPPTCA